MSEENKSVELEDKELKQVTGGNEEHRMVVERIGIKYSEIINITSGLPAEVTSNPVFVQFKTAVSFAHIALGTSFIFAVKEKNNEIAQFLNTLKQQHPESGQIFEEIEKVFNEILELSKALHSPSWG